MDRLRASLKGLYFPIEEGIDYEYERRIMKSRPKSSIVLMFKLAYVSSLAFAIPYNNIHIKTSLFYAKEEQISLNLKRRRRQS